MWARASRDHEKPRKATISTSQSLAIDALLTGATITAAAQAANVARETVHGWIKDDYVFAAELNSRQAWLLAESRRRLLSLAEKALETVQGAIERGDAKVALQILDRMGILAKPSIGSSDPEIVEREQWIAQKQKDAELTRDELCAGL